MKVAKSRLFLKNTFLDCIAGCASRNKNVVLIKNGRNGKYATSKRLNTVKTKMVSTNAADNAMSSMKFNHFVFSSLQKSGTNARHVPAMKCGKPIRNIRRYGIKHSELMTLKTICLDENCDKTSNPYKNKEHTIKNGVRLFI